MSLDRHKSSDQLMRSTKRVKRSHEMLECVIELENGFIGRHLIGQLVPEIFKYFLYDRQQIPFPMTNSKSLDQLELKSIAKQLTLKEEQTLQMYNDLTKLLDEVICLLTLDDIIVECVSLSLGQTLQMPKELYCIELPVPDIYTVRHSADCPKQTLRSAVTRFFKTILNDVNILSQRKDISTTKMFVLIKVNKRYIQQVMDHSSNCHHLSQQRDGCSAQLFTPHVEYEIPKIGNRFKLILRQKQCNCRHFSDIDFEIYNESFGENTIQTVGTVPTDDKHMEQQLSQTMTDVLTLNEDITEEEKQTKDEFIWIQILSSIKGIQLNSKNIY